MPLARLVVIDGPDAGREFELPMRGGGVGRGDGNLVQLTDPAVSRLHGSIELREGALYWIDDAPPLQKARTLINGRAPTEHRLEAGDEIVLGSTRLAYLPDHGVAVTRTSSHVTMEIGSMQLLTLTGIDDRARRQLAALAQLGDRLREEAAAGRDAVARATCDAALTALGAHRAFVLALARGADAEASTGRPRTRVAPIAAVVAPGESTQLQAPADVVDKVTTEQQVVTAESGGRALIAAPIHGLGAEIVGVLWIDRRGAPWDATDTAVVGCLAHLAAAAWVGAETRESLVKRADALEEELRGPAGPPDFLGRSPAAQRVLEFVKRVAPSDATVLLGGESGSGKEMVARAIHRSSRRAKGPCVAVNCAALTETLIESELFGHEKGAFTGATEKQLGRFEMADKGTLFLDEVGELPLGLQTKFLRVLEERRFERVGGQKAIDVDVRVVAATNRDLMEMVRRGTFREDLYYRLGVIHTDVPPLRDRAEDIPLLAEHFLARFKQSAGRRISGFAKDALVAMQRYPWPGNVRELRNAVERAVVLGDRDTLQLADLPPPVVAASGSGFSVAGLGAGGHGTHAGPASSGSFAGSSGSARPRLASPTPPLGSSISMAIPAASQPAVPELVIDLPSSQATGPGAKLAPTTTPVARSLKDLEREGILAALAATHGNKAQAAAILEIDRSTLYKKLKDYGIES